MEISDLFMEINFVVREIIYTFAEIIKLSDGSNI